LLHVAGDVLTFAKVKAGIKSRIFSFDFFVIKIQNLTLCFLFTGVC